MMVSVHFTILFQIRAKLVSKQAFEERMEKVRKLRELRKFGKKVQAEVQLKRQKEKREMLDQVIKHRDDAPCESGEVNHVCLCR